MNRNIVFSVSIFLLASAVGSRALEMRHQPLHPTLNDVIHIEILGCSQPGTLHWGVNAVGTAWEQALPAYRPEGSVMDGVATRTALEGPDAEGVCRIALGPFSDTNQLVRALNFAIQWKDGTWSNKDEKNYNIPVSFGRITVEPERPTINDRIVVTVHRSAAGGLLRWGVNAENDLWQPPVKAYWPAGTFPAKDGLAVDTPIGKPDANGKSTVVLGPFHRADQVIRTLHMAVHWGDVWDTDAARNYNVEIAPESSTNAPHVRIVSPADGEVVVDAPQVLLQADRAERVEMWLNDKSIATVSETPFELRVPFQQLKYGRHLLAARAEGGGLADIEQVQFWKLPPHKVESIPPGTPWGATENGDGTVTFALHAPGKRFVSLVGDFNAWDPYADMMNLSPDGTWWLTRPVSNGVSKYQYCIEGRRVLADPYSRDVDWKDDKGRESYQPWEAKSVLAVGRPAYAWKATNYVRPELRNLVVYEFHIDDLCPGQGYTGVIAKLDYIKGLGVTAIEPLPWTEFALDHSWGYNPAFHFAPESTYGTPDDLRRMIDEAHLRGLAVIMDGVFNHMDRNSALFQLYGHDYDASPYFRLFRGENWGFPDIDQETRATKRYMADAIRLWLTEYRVDGIRYDATRFVEWQGYNDWGASWFAYAGRQADPGSIHIAEHLPSDPELINATEMDSTWHDHFHWGLKHMIHDARLDRDAFEKVMDPRTVGFTNAFQRMAYMESHDEERLIRELRLKGYAPSEVYRRAQMALAITLTAPGTVMIYSGQEFGEDTPKVVGSNPLQWQKLQGWRNRDNRRLQDVARALIRLRTSHPALRTENVRILRDGLPEDVVVYERMDGDAGVVVAANLGKRGRRAAVTLPHHGTWTNVLDGGAVDVARDGSTTFILEAGAVAVLATYGDAPSPAVAAATPDPAAP